MASADVTYERHMVGSRRMLELGQLQDSFHVLLSQAHPDHIAAFFCWLDLQVAQFKVFGGSVSQGNDFCSPQKARHGGISNENPTVNGNLYTPEHPQRGDAYIASRELNGTQAEDRRSQPASLVNAVESMPPLYSIPELDISSSHADDSNNKQMVKSLLRAMLAKPRPSDVSSLMEFTMKSEFDSGSEDTGDQQAPGGDGKDDDSTPANDTVTRDDATAVESETDTQQNWLSSATVSPEKVSRCPYCLKVFRYRSSYRRHVKIHEGVFSHECTICMRKFTRKEHFVRHKCDRRPNKPYNVTHDAFRRMSASQKASIRHILNSAVSGDAGSPMGLAAASQELEGPLELTCPSVSKPVDMPKLLFTGGSVSSMLPMSLDGSTSSVCSPISTVTYTPAQSSDIISSSVRGIDTSLPPHNESRRKSSTPRKVVVATNGTIESDSCRGNFSSGRLVTLGSLPVSVMD